MTPFIIVGLVVLIAIGVPIAIALGLICLFYFLVNGIPIGVLIQQSFQGANKFVLAAIFFFLFTGNVFNASGTSKNLVDLTDKLVGHVRGGLAQVNVVVSMLFAGISGSAVADTAAIGSILIPRMVKEGYSKKFTCAVTGASSVVGPIIPPSMPMIIAAYLSRQSVSKMFVGGIVPGILFGGGMMIWSYVYSKRHGFPFKKRASLTEILKTFKSALLPLLAPVIILGGIFTGAFTVTEIGAIAAIYGIFLGFFYFKELNFKKFLQVAYNTAMKTGSIMIIVALANVYTWMLTRERAPQLLYQFVLNLTSDPLIILLLIIASLLTFGCFLSTTPAIILAVPILLPLVKQVGFDPVYFFVLLTVTLCIGTITPPVGLTLYMVSSIGKVAPESVLKPLLPFFAIMIGVVLLCVFFPPIILWLVHFIKY